MTVTPAPLLWNLKQQAPLKRWYLSTTLHGVTSHLIIMLIFSATRNSNFVTHLADTFDSPWFHSSFPVVPCDPHIEKILYTMHMSQPHCKWCLVGSHTVYDNTFIPTFRRKVLLSIQVNHIQWSWRWRHQFPPKLRNKHYPTRCKQPKDYQGNKAPIKRWELKPRLSMNFEL